MTGIHWLLWRDFQNWRGVFVSQGSAAIHFRRSWVFL